MNAPAAALGPLRIVPMGPEDWPAVRTIYEQGIATGHATFAAAPPGSWAEWDRGHLAAGRAVARGPGGVAGWTALSAVSDRCVYQGVAELSVYVAEGWRGQGIGQRLLAELVTAAEAAGIWTLQAGIFPENAASLALHRRLGFREVGRRERIARMPLGPWAGRWRDVLLLERRSPVTGVR